MEKDNIKIFIFNRAHNYGAFLQVYALQEKIKMLNYDVQVVDLKVNEIVKNYKIFKISKNIKTTIKRIIYLKKDYRNLKVRYNNFKRIIEEKLNLTKAVKRLSQIKNVLNKKDILITGSDQVWNAEIINNKFDLFTLAIPGNNYKISYAASVGDVKLIEKYKEKYINNIGKIDKISVREKDAEIKLKQLINKPIEIVLDPTLLLTCAKWNELVKNTHKVKEKYICAYVVSPDEEYVKIVNQISATTGLKVIHFGLRNPGYKNVLQTAYTEGPLNFVDYIRNAEYVVTTSFHATVFSIIYNKKFFVVPHSKTGSRVTNLLKKLEIKERDFEKFEQFKGVDIDFETNWEVVNRNLEIERKKSEKWLMDAINEWEHK